jgi:hypothetical protein
VRLLQPTRSILLAEEDAATRPFLADNLTADGYRVLDLLARLAADPMRVSRDGGPRWHTPCFTLG